MSVSLTKTNYVLYVMYLTRALLLLLLSTAACLAEKQQIPISYSFEATIIHVSHSSRVPNHYNPDVGDPTTEKEQSLLKLLLRYSK
jgi:hypothetical protein